MCKNADNPCPGCGKQKTADARWMFFSEVERSALEGQTHVERRLARAPARIGRIVADTPVVQRNVQLGGGI